MFIVTAAKKVIPVPGTSSATVVTEHNVRPSSMQSSSHKDKAEVSLTDVDELHSKMINSVIEGQIAKAEMPLEAGTEQQRHDKLLNSGRDLSEEHLVKPSLIKSKTTGSSANVKPSELFKNKLNCTRLELNRDSRSAPSSPSKCTKQEPALSHASQHSLEQKPSQNKKVYVEHLIKPSEMREQKTDTSENKENARQGALHVGKPELITKPIIMDGMYVVMVEQ